MGVSQYIKNVIQPFMAEHYQYKVDASIGDVANDIHALLSSKNLLGSPNITGKLKQYSFEAYHKWTMVVIKGGGGNAVTLYGTIKPLNRDSTLINLSVDSNVLFPALAIINLLVTITLLYLYVVKTGLRLSGEEWAGAAVALVAMVLWAAFAWLVPYNMKRNLRYTFEVNMGIQPIEKAGV